MSLTVSNSGGGDYEQLPEGSYVARCIKVIDLGTQTTEWNGEKKHRPKVMITWEILDDETKMKDGRPFAITKRYTASLHEKAQLRKDLQAWRGKRFTDEELEGFDLKNVLGTYCAMQVTHSEGNNGNNYENIEAIMSTREKPEPVNDTIYFDLSDPDMSLFEGFSDRLKETILASPEGQFMGSQPVDLNDIPDDDPDPTAKDDDSEPGDAAVDLTKYLTTSQLKEIRAALNAMKITVPAQRLEVLSTITNRKVEALNTLTRDEAELVLSEMRKL